MTGAKRLFLFVCTANIVRSFMAERILRAKLRNAGRSDIDVISAGLVDMNGSPADPLAVKLLTETGIDGSGHVSKVIDEELVDRADMIIVMEKSHRRYLAKAYPGAQGKIFLLKSFDHNLQEKDNDIKDPHGQSVFHYRVVFAEISLALDGLMQCI